MLITNLELTNVGRYERLTFNANSPVIGLLGPNGVGKSTVLEMLKFLFTGETEDNIDSYVRYGEGNASAQATFVKNGKVGTIFRQFGKTNKRRLTWDGAEKKKSSEVDAIMAEIFAADKKAIANAVFIRQGALEQILFSGESDRRSMFIKVVNMAFCAQRSNSILAKVKKLEATIVDLGPMIQAMDIQRNTAAGDLEIARKEMETFKNYSVEVAFCEAFILNEAMLRAVTKDIGNAASEEGRLKAEFENILRVLRCESIDAAKIKMSNLESEINRTAKDVTKFDSIAAEIMHYDRVSREIKDATENVNNSINEINRLNPECKALEVIQSECKYAKAQEDLYPRRLQLQQALDQWQQFVMKIRSEVSARPLPPKTQEQLNVTHNQITESLAKVSSLSRMLESQYKIAACIKDQLALDSATCPDCGLTLSNPKQLSPDALASTSQYLSDMRAAYDRQREELVADQKALHEYQTFLASKKELLLNGETQMAQIQDELNQTVPTMEFDEAHSTYVRTNEQMIRLPVLSKNSNHFAEVIKAKMRERMGYKMALEHLSRRNEFSADRGHSIRKMASDAVAALEAAKEPFNQLIQAQHEIEMNRKAQDELRKKQNEAHRLLEQPMPSSILELVIPLNNNMEAVKTELQSRNDVRQQAVGRFKQADQNYQKANNEYQDLRRRAEVDAEKRKLIEDLKVLRGVMDDEGLPMAVVRYHFGKLAALTQECLLQLDANFTIMVNPDQELAFDFMRLDEPVQYVMPMNKLSGGQRVRLCIAFLMAVQKRLVREVGLLVLDEPSVHIDQPGVESLAELLRMLQGQLKDTEMQVWISDHHPSLTNCFSTTIQLK